EVGQAIALSAIDNMDDGGLLEIRFRGGGEGDGEKQAQQRLGNRTVGIAAMGSAQQDLAQPFDLRDLIRKTRFVAKAGTPFGFVAGTHLFAWVGWADAVGLGQDGISRAMSTSSKT